MRIQYEYPGDSVEDADLMFGREFKDQHRGREMVVSTANETSRIPWPDGTALCDACNDEVADLDPCAVTEWGLFCGPCFTRIIKPHVLPRMEE